MKKIVTAAAIAAMAASFAAAEVTTSLNVRVRPDLYKVEGITKTKTADAYTKTTYADIDGVATNSDTLAVKGSTDYAGVVAEITLLNPGNKNTENGGVKIDNYYGWLNWGALKFTAGTYDSRYTNRGNYTATEQGILDEEFSKTHGLSIKNGLSKTAFGKTGGFSWLVDFGNVSQVAAGNNTSFIADYTFNDIAGGKLLLKGGLVENGSNKQYDDTTDATKKDKDVFKQSEGYVFEAAWRKDGIAAVDFIFKNPVNKLYGFGLYVTPLMIANTKNVVVGFTYGMDTNDYDKKENGLDKAFAIDLRGQYNINSNMTVALGAKYESVSYQNDVSLTDSDGKTVKESSASAMQVAAEFSYKVNDIVTAAFDFGYFNEDLTDVDSNSDDSSQFIVTSLRGKFTAGKNAAITTALRLNKVLNPKDGGTDYTFDIPVVLRVKM
ncbi:hypothetical protein [Treponema berlinense]|uniref:hypothetical protein n=1 Tax=Treponema berlinense TaxID=225004 RepID=UPI003FD7472B